MPNVASILKQEIARVARKEAKSFFKALPGSLSGLKKTVSEQKRKIAALEAKVDKLEKALAKDSKIAIPKPEELEHSRLGAKNVAKLRKKLNLTRAEMAKLIGVNPNSIFLWENDKATPRAAARAKIIALRGLGKKEIKKLLGEEEPASGSEKELAKLREKFANAKTFADVEPHLKNVPSYPELKDILLKHLRRLKVNRKLFNRLFDSCTRWLFPLESYEEKVQSVKKIRQELENTLFGARKRSRKLKQESPKTPKKPSKRAKKATKAAEPVEAPAAAETASESNKA